MTTGKILYLVNATHFVMGSVFNDVMDEDRRVRGKTRFIGLGLKLFSRRGTFKAEAVFWKF